MDEIAVAGGGVVLAFWKGGPGEAVEVFDRMRERRLVEPRRIIKKWLLWSRRLHVYMR